MFVNTVGCAETYRAITRPAIIASIEQLLDFYQIDMKKCQIYFNGDAEASKLFGSNYDSVRGDDKQTDFQNRDKLYVIANVDDSEFNSGYSNNYRQDTHIAFWRDEETKTSIRPQFVGKRVTVEINRHFRTRQEAVNFKNTIERIRTEQMAAFTFNATVHFPINTSLVELFNDVYKLLVNGGGVDQTKVNFSQWLMNNARRSLKVINNLAGNNKILVAPVLIENTEVIQDEPNISKVTKGGYLGRYEVSFSYYFSWLEFIGWQVTYPFMIYQQPIPTKYINPVIKNFQRDQTLTGFLERTQMMLLTKGNEKLLHNPYYEKIPVEDPWVPKPENYMEPKIRITLSLDKVPSQVLFNIKQIPNFTWNPFYLNFLIRYREFIFQKYNNPLSLYIYSDKIQIDPRDLSMNENGDVILNRPPVIKNTHRAVLFVNYDIRLWSETCVKNLLADRAETKKLIDYIMPWLKIPEDWDEEWFNDVIGEPNIKPPIYQMAIGLRALRNDAS